MMRSFLYSLLPITALAAAVDVRSGYGERHCSIARTVANCGKATIRARNDPNIIPLKAEFNLPGSTRVKVKYGPYTLPALNDTSAPKMPMKDAYGNEGMEDEGGLFDTMSDSITKPCDDCLLKYSHSNLEYEDGSTANLNTGAWLHHLAVSADGPNKVDLACGTKGSERLLAAHNDRADTVFGVSGADKMGYYLAAEDKLSMKLELKNEALVPRKVFLTITWEFIPGKPEGYKNVKTLWLDAAECGAPSSEIPPPDGDVFTLTSKPWLADADGYKLLNTLGHMHDGGQHLEIYANDKLVCDSVATYGGDPLYVTAEGADKNDHISKMGLCQKFAELKKGDKLHLKAYYDFEKHSGLRNLKGKLSGVMGISVVFVEVPFTADK
jgi:hypothetical protein